MRTIWITGAAGFIGSHYARLIYNTEKQTKIIILDKFSYSGDHARIDDISKDTKRVQVWMPPLERSDDVQAFARAQGAPDEIVHFAAETHVDNSIGGPGPFIHSNFVGTFNLLEVARANRKKVKKFVHISTDEVLGSASKPFKTEAPHNPSNVYAATKAGAEDLVNAYHTTWKLPVTVVRMVNNYGPWQHKEKAIPTFVRAVIEGTPIPLYGQGEHRRCWLHVEDACKAVNLIRRNGSFGKIYHVGSDTELRNRDLVDKITRLLGAPNHPIRFIPDKIARPGHDTRYLLDDKITRDELGWEQEIPFLQGLKDTVLWFKEYFSRQRVA